MIVALAHRHDSGARGWAERHRAQGVRLLTAADLSSPGWNHRPVGSGATESFVASGEVFHTSFVEHAVSFLAHVQPEELFHLRGEDRGYAAREMTAFLRSWLASLRCPVSNPIEPNGTLAGPLWRRERWLALARRHGLVVATARRHWPPRAATAGAPEARLTVVGEELVGNCSSATASAARTLSKAAKAPLLAVGLIDGQVSSISTVVDPSEPAVGAAVMRWVRR